jgi:hypothetical protein
VTYQRAAQRHKRAHTDLLQAKSQEGMKSTEHMKLEQSAWSYGLDSQLNEMSKRKHSLNLKFIRLEDELKMHRQIKNTNEQMIKAY